MLKLIMPAFISCLYASSAVAACNYRFDATSSDYTNLPVQAFTTQSGQTFSGQISTSQTKPWYALSHAGAVALSTGQIIGNGVSVPTSGIFVLEQQISSYPTTLPTNGYVNISLVLPVSTASQTYQLSINLIGQTGGGALEANVNLFNIAGGASYNQSIPISLPLSSNFRIGTYFNQNSGQVGLVINGVNYGYISYTLPQPLKEVLPILWGLGVTQSSDPILGGTLQTTLITDSTQISNNYPTGATDICGNTI